MAQGCISAVLCVTASQVRCCMPRGGGEARYGVTQGASQ